MTLTLIKYPFQGRQRRYLYHNSGGRAATFGGRAVIFGLHGKGQTAEAFANEAKFHERCPNAFVIYPQGAGLIPSWNAGSEPPTTWAEEQGIDDIAFIENLARHVSNRGPIYAAGISNGGRLCYHLAGDAALLAGMASVAGVPTDPTISRPSPCPILHLHGDADWIEPFDGGGPAGHVGAAAGLQRFREAGYPVTVTMVPGGRHRWDFGIGHDTTGTILAAWGLG